VAVSVHCRSGGDKPLSPRSSPSVGARRGRPSFPNDDLALVELLTLATGTGMLATIADYVTNVGQKSPRKRDHWQIYQDQWPY
jgi:hypothetical protein